MLLFLTVERVMYLSFCSTITAFGRMELEWCERKILLSWLELELVVGVV